MKNNQLLTVANKLTCERKLIPQIEYFKLKRTDLGRYYKSNIDAKLVPFAARKIELQLLL